MSDKGEQSISTSMIYKTMERYLVMAFQMIVQIVIARILSPTDYGLIAMMSVFISIANVFIQNGFNTAIIQKKEADARDFGTALLLNFIIGCILYCLLYVFAPAIASFYNEPQLCKCLRILSVILPIGAISSIQSAIAMRRMRFRNLFICNVIASVLSGIIGIFAAILGAGYWALILQQISNVIVIVIVLTYHATWKPRFALDINSAKEQFGFGWKMLSASLLNAVYNELNSLIIGKKYSAADLSYYTKGRSFPNLITSGVDSALQSVILSSLSKKQDNEKDLHRLIKLSSVSNTFILVPILTFLAVSGNTIVQILLTDKWLPMVPFMQICCFTYAFHPIASINMQVLAAIGRSDMRLKLEFIKKPFGILMLVLAIPHGPMGIAFSAAITSIFSLLVGLIACQRIIHYRIIDSFKDLCPYWIISLISGLIIYLLNYIAMNNLLLLVLQAILMTLSYYILSRGLNLLGYQIFKEKYYQLKNQLISNKRN